MKFAPDSLYFYKDLPPEKQFKAIKNAGFDHIEILFPYFTPLPELKTLLLDNGLGLPVMDVLPGNIQVMDINAAVDPKREKEFKLNAEKAVAYATDLSVKNINCLSGIFTATPDLSREKQLDLFRKNLLFLCNLVKGSDISILLEPISPKVIPDYHFSDLPRTVDFIKEMNHSNLGLQFDFFHIQMLHGNLLGNAEKYSSFTRYYQIANAPERNEPGKGEIDFSFLLEAIVKRGYKDPFGLEYIPSCGMDKTFEWIKKIVRRTDK